MRMNLARWDKWLRLFVGILATAWAIAGGPWWSYVGVYLIFSGSWGFCAMYAFFGLSTSPHRDQNFLPPDL